jgi:SanA protein
MGTLKTMGKWFLYGAGGLLLVGVCLNFWVIASTEAEIFKSIETIPARPVGLVLGTSSKTTSGKPNLFFEHRIRAAADLYHQGKIERIIVSGDNQSSPYYNEPLQMKKALLQNGVPEAAIIVDDAGVRTFDSVLRCRSVFGATHVTIITQRFHGYRALFISHHSDLQAQVLAAPGIPLSQASARVYVREFFARSQAVLDLFVFKTRVDV